MTPRQREFPGWQRVGAAKGHAERRLAYCGMLLVLVAAATLGHAAREIRADAGATSTFEGLDADGDGFVSREEAQAHESFVVAFDQVDVNGAGRLDARQFAEAQGIHDRMRAEQLVNDSMTSARVKLALLKDSRVNGLDVRVETHRGTVALSGVLDDEEQARRAVEIASGVRGVVSVHNDLKTMNTAESSAGGKGRE